MFNTRKKNNEKLINKKILCHVKCETVYFLKSFNQSNQTQTHISQIFTQAVEVTQNFIQAVENFV